jgi:hypothetical protein
VLRLWNKFATRIGRFRIHMTKPKPKDQLQKRGRKSVFRPEYILIAKACARFGAIEDEIANELKTTQSSGKIEPRGFVARSSHHVFNFISVDLLFGEPPQQLPFGGSDFVGAHGVLNTNGFVFLSGRSGPCTFW